MNFSVSSLFFDLALIFMPGFIWMKIHTRYGPKIERTQFDLILNAFIFGVLSYAVLFSIYWYKGWTFKLLELEASSNRLIQPEVFPEILVGRGDRHCRRCGRTVRRELQAAHALCSTDSRDQHLWRRRRVGFCL